MERAEDRQTRSRFPPGIRYMAGAAFLFSLMSLFVKVAGRRLPTSELVLARGVVIVAITLVMLRRAGTSPWGRRRRLLLLRGLLGFAAVGCFYYALSHIPLADATVIQYTNPVWTALLAAAFLDERLRPVEVVGIASSLAGVVLVTRPSFLFGSEAAHLDPVVAGIALAGAVLSASAYVSVRKLNETEEPLVIVFYFALVSTLGAAPIAATRALWPTPGEWLALAGVGITAQLAQLLMTHGLRRERAGRAMAVGYLQIVFAAAWGAIFFSEIPGVWTFAGAGLVVAGTWAAGRRAGAEAA
ncbi:MAG TPA: DMT family transporter [Gemmatimonadota bacterium]|nr:DMT family transporter [Gemmatimonadota bacterium]